MRDMEKKRAHDRRRHAERMANDLHYRMRKVLNTINARCKSGKGRKDWKYYGAKGLAVTLTIDELITLWQRDNAALMEKPTIDRIDSDSGYTFSNCQFIECADNSRKAVDRRAA
jgi:hypothetical protein